MSSFLSKDGMLCKTCEIPLKHRDFTKRIIRIDNGKYKWVSIERVRCPICGAIKRVLPKDILPYKHYSRSIIVAVLNGTITSETIGYEDYPCEMSMKRWKSQYLQGLCRQ